MSSFRTLDHLAPKGKRVLLRVDLNVPMENGEVADATRIDRVLPTIRELSDKGGKVILLAHFGRPKNGPDKENSLAPIGAALAKRLGKPVAFADDCVGPTAAAAVAAMKDGDVLLLENTRFHKGEEKNAAEIVDGLAALGDAYVNDAFSAAHRAHASTEGVAKKLPAYAGRAMQQELDALDKALGNPKKPVCAIVGGAKVSTKIDLLQNLVKKVESLVIGGAMANTFLYAQGIDVGKSLVEKDLADTARAILAAASQARCAIVLPIDAVVAFEFKAGAQAHDYGADAIPANGMMLDVGPRSVERIKAVIDASATVVWNGPMGAFEIQPFDTGTNAVAKHVAQRVKSGKLIAVAGGGDTVAALAHAGVVDDMTYVSTAGGAFLEWMEGKALPGVEALKA
jgi:phosphoglycerate kinase